MKILLVDDSRFSRMLLKKEIEILQPTATLFEAESAKEGMLFFDKEAPDLLITDMLMPEVSGLELVRYVRSKNQDCFVAVVSANIQDRVQKEAASLGADMFVGKPVKGKKIHSILRAYAEKAEAST